MLLAVYKKIGGKTIDEDKIQSQDVENHVGIEQEYSLLGRFFFNTGRSYDWLLAKKYNTPTDIFQQRTLCTTVMISMTRYDHGCNRDVIEM